MFNISTNTPKKPVILVQGGSGQIGFPIVAQLLRAVGREYSVRAGVVDVNSEKARRLVDMGAHVVLMDTERPETVACALKGVSKLMIVPPRLENNTEIATTIIDYAKTVGTIKHVVVISVVGADTEATCFAKQFRPIEKRLEKSNLPWTVLRCAYLMDNLWHHADSIRKTNSIQLPLRDVKVPIVSGRDVGEAAAMVLTGKAPGTHINKVYELTGPEAVSGTDIARALSQVSGTPVRYQAVVPDETKHHLKCLGISEWEMRVMCDLYTMISAGLISDRVSPDLERLLQRRPATVLKFFKHNINTFSSKAVIQKA